MRKFLIFHLYILFFFLHCAIGFADTSSSKIDEHKAAAVKGVYLYYIAVEFTQWPAHLFADDDSPINICMLGKDEFGIFKALEVAIQNKTPTIERRKAVIHRFSSIPISNKIFINKKLRQCHLLFLTKNQKDIWSDLKLLIEGWPLVTVSEMSGFAISGGMIELSPKLKKEPDYQLSIQFVVSLNSINNSRIKFDSRFLGLKKGITFVDSND